MSTEEELKIASKLEARLTAAQKKNIDKNEYYYQKKEPTLFSTADLIVNKQCKSITGWATSAVDVIIDKIKMEGFYNPDPSDADLEDTTQWLNDTYRDNFFESEQSYAHKDSSITGISFISVGKGVVENGEPEVIWIAENSSTMTVDFDRRTRSVKSAFKIYKGATDDDADTAVLYLPNSTINLVRVDDTWVETSRDDHELGFVAVVPVFNNADSKYIYGKSDITPSLRYFIDTAQRILYESETNLRRLSSPIRYISGMSKKDLDGIKENGSSVLKFQKGDFLHLPTNIMDGENGSPLVPTIGQLPANDPNIVLNMIQSVARLAAHEAGVPETTFGFSTVNPTSADAINAADNGLNKRAATRIEQLKRTYKLLAKVSLAVAGRDQPENWNLIDSVFKNTQVSSPNAVADKLSKEVAIGLFEKEYPEFLYRELGYSPAEIIDLKRVVRTRGNTNIIDKLTSEG